MYTIYYHLPFIKQQSQSGLQILIQINVQVQYEVDGFKKGLLRQT